MEQDPFTADVLMQYPATATGVLELFSCVTYENQFP